MILPWGTDAPIYHWPFATVGMIVLNVAVYAGEVNEVVDEQWALALGEGLHPVQWLTHNFLHINAMHLIGNLIFLWAFGIIVEGKLGWLGFTGLYLLTGTLHGALVQALMLGIEPTVAVGASAVVFGLLAICMVWAPKNEITCYVILSSFVRFWVFVWDVPIALLALFFIGKETLWMGLAGMTGLTAGSAIGHLSGAFWGFLLGSLLVKFRWVDCEGWDVYSLMTKRRDLRRKWEQRCRDLDRARAPKVVRNPVHAEAAADASTDEERSASALRRVRGLLEMGDFEAARRAYDKAARVLAGWPSEPELLGMIKLLHGRNALVPSIPWLRDYCRLYPPRAGRIRLRLAMILLREQQRPRGALRILAEIPPGTLSTDLEPIRAQLQREANQMQAEGVLELEGDD